MNLNLKKHVCDCGNNTFYLHIGFSYGVPFINYKCVKCGIENYEELN